MTNETDVKTEEAGMPKDVPTPQTPSVGPTYDKDLVYSPEGKLWKDLYHGQKGRVQQVEEEYQTRLGETTKTVDELKSEVNKRDSAMDKLNTRLGEAADRLAQLQALEEKVPELEKKAGITERYRTLLEYPELAVLQVSDTVETDDGEEVEIFTNPFIELIENSTLEGNELRVQMQRLSKAFGERKEAVEELAKGITEGASPSPGEPVEETPEFWENKARECQNQLRAVPDDNDLMEKMIEYSRKAQDLRAKTES